MQSSSEEKLEVESHAQSASAGESKNYALAVAHEEMNPRRRNTMEDCHRILARLDPALPSYSFFSIYDGHGGRQIVDFLENALEKSVATELAVDDDASLNERITRAFLITDMESRKLNITTSGATAVVALLFPCADNPSSRKLVVANVGDSRAVLANRVRPADAIEDSESGYFGQRLTVDHRADDRAEQARITQAGGFVARNRVLGILAVTRSFGDHGMKDFVVATPYIAEALLTDAQDTPFLILACDGVWDVLSDQEAVDLIMSSYREKGPFEGAAELLAQTALEKGSTDNITAIVVFF